MVDTRIRLNSGRVNTWVEKQRPESRYEISTPAAITAVRGTAFRLSSDTELVSRTEVTAGIVGVSAGGTEKQVNDGYGIVAEKDKPLPEPVKLLAAPEVSENLSAVNSELYVSWKKLEGAKAYRYRLASDQQFNQTTIDESTESNSIKLTGLAPGHYYLQVRGIDQFRLEGVDAINDYEIQQTPPPPVADDSYWKVIMTTGIVVLLIL
jgi:hypothetical protein